MIARSPGVSFSCWYLVDRGIATAWARTLQLLLDDCPRRVSRPHVFSLGFEDLEVERLS